MRVLEVMESTIGGTRRHLVDLAAGLAAAGDEVHLCVSAEREPRFRADLADLAAAGVVVHEVPMVRSISPLQDLRHQRAIEALLREVQPDVVHTHSSKAGVLGRNASRSTGIGVRVHTPHTFAFLFDAMFGVLKRRAFRMIEAYLGKRTGRLIAVSQGEAETMCAAPPGGGPGVIQEHRVRVVVNGVDPTRWAGAEPLLRAELGLGEDDVVVLVAGLLNPAKGQDLAIEAFTRGPLAGRSGVKLLLAGHGDDLPQLEALVARHGLGERVTFLGWRDDLPRLMATADLLLLPSRWEGMPYAVLEAMAAGLPVVAARVDGARDLVEELAPGAGTGLVVDAGDPDAMADAVARLAELDAAERRAIGARGAARVTEHFTIEHMVQRTRAVFREAMEERA